MPTVRSITLDELDNIGLDEDNNLYWLGRPVVVRRRISLPWFVTASAVAAGLATLTMAALDVCRFFGWTYLSLTS